MVALEEHGGALDQEVVAFVEQHINSLLAWDIVVFFHQHPEESFDVGTLATRLGREVVEVAPEVESLCGAGILESAGGLIRYRATSAYAPTVDHFAQACRSRSRRLALIALVLQKINPSFNG